MSTLATTRRTPSVSGVPAGLHVVAHLPPGLAEAAVLQSAARRGLALDAIGPLCAPGIDHPPALVLGYGTPPAHLYTSALHRLAAALHDATG